MITLDTLELPRELVWVDEMEWTPILQSEEYMLSGALDIQCGKKMAGRPITLAREQGEVWAPRTLILALMELAEEPGKQMTLTLHDGRAYKVIFKQSDKPIESKQVVEYHDPITDTWYTLALKFLAIEEL